MEMLKINPKYPEPDKIACAAEAILKGGVIGYPTETVYGLGASAFKSEAVARIFELKGREASQAILLIASDLEQVAGIVSEIPDVAVTLADEFWPGPLTLIFNAGKNVLSGLTGTGGTIGVRIPGNKICLDLLNAAGVPITSTSANISGGQNPISAKEVLKYFRNELDLIIDGGETPSRTPSTVISVADNQAVLFREGAVKIYEIEKILGKKVYETKNG